MKALVMVFFSVFLAELGDKTQLATLLFATDGKMGRLGVFFAASGALVFSSLLAVLFGAQIARYISPVALKIAAGSGFILIGIWMVIGARS